MWNLLLVRIRYGFNDVDAFIVANIYKMERKFVVVQRINNNHYLFWHSLSGCAVENKVKEFSICEIDLMCDKMSLIESRIFSIK